MMKKKLRASLGTLIAILLTVSLALNAFAAAIERWLTENPPMPPGEFVSLLKTALGGVPLQTK